MSRPRNGNAGTLESTGIISEDDPEQLLATDGDQIKTAELDELELPLVIAEALDSWARIVSQARDDEVPGVLRRAARELFHARRVLKRTSPETDAIVNVEIVDRLADLARAAGMDDAEAQQIFAEAALNDEPPTQARTEPQRPNLPIIVSSGEFIANFVPPDYLVDGLLIEGFLYSLTGATGAGKTCITLRLSACVARGAVFAGRETKKRRVLYLAAENPEDVRMRWIALSQQMDFPLEEIEVYFIEGAFRISEMADHIKSEAAKRGGEFGLVVVDTGPVFYEGDEENNRKQQGNDAELMRSLIKIIPGKPTVIANCHPVKNAGADNLLPAGGGNFLNQVDGNLTAAKTESTSELHWQGKFRGVEFAPIHFLIRTVTHERLRDKKGRLMPTVICEPISDTRQEEIEKQTGADDLQVLKHLAKFPRASLTEIASAMGWKYFNGDAHKTRANRAAKRLVGEKLLKRDKQGRWNLTKEGKKTIDVEG